MKLSLIYLSLFAASASAAAIPASDDLAVRDNHSPVAPPENHPPRENHGTRDNVIVSFADLEAQLQQAEHDRQVLLSLGEVEAAQRKVEYIAQLRTALEAYRNAENNNGAIWSRDHNRKRASFSVSFSELDAQIRKLEQEIEILQRLGERESVERRQRQLAQLKHQRETYADAERNNANRFGGRSLELEERDDDPDHGDLGTRGSVKVNIDELKAKIRKAQKDYDTLRSMGEHAAAKRKLKYLNALKAKLKAYEDADSNAAGHFKRSLAEFDAFDLARMG
ncbi:hypothetical protein A1Q2_00151 [Trichosporon asahii var. asahii CBS 8904]|uniref:Uncharacterized protein n=2 Tax=Trichosporon asahii var. asahii TaxID=189963 RepID=K1W162_TRIAC|nr:hypothetical protein A1Q1_03313 [Trichosporon asahii var. asahii CBS 2479]EJT47852.1 hypothetical protein A1Q1_03313 [Trichosporon asahii var. asahii CBS 2479]EKD05537.1 hypothetical protein A1Q2_00151 [Trichosporon asahii var. asahii CBS 8904]